jgi:hypothetical protein
MEDGVVWRWLQASHGARLELVYIVVSPVYLQI